MSGGNRVIGARAALDAGYPEVDELVLALHVRQSMSARGERLAIDVGVADRFQLEGVGAGLQAGNLADVQV